MKTFEQWMHEYGESHRNETNKMIHKVAVPLIMFSVIGMLWSIPIPNFFRTLPYLNWATLFIVSCLFFYSALNLMMFIGMFFLTIVMIIGCILLQQQGVLLTASIIIFVLSWIAQFYGHKVEGKKPSFLKDLVFLLIGPLWVLRFFYAKLGISV